MHPCPSLSHVPALAVLSGRGSAAPGGFECLGHPEESHPPLEEQGVNPSLWIQSLPEAPGSGAVEGLESSIKPPAQRSHCSHSQTIFQAGTALSAQI